MILDLIGHEIIYDEENVNFIWYDGPRQFIYETNEENYLFSSFDDKKINDKWYYLYQIDKLDDPNVLLNVNETDYSKGQYVVVLDEDFIVVDVIVVFSF